MKSSFVVKMVYLMSLPNIIFTVSLHAITCNLCTHHVNRFSNDYMTLLPTKSGKTLTTVPARLLLN